MPRVACNSWWNPENMDWTLTGGTVLKDGTMLEDALALQEIGLQSRPAGEFDVLIAQDAGVAKARKVMERLLAAERVPASPTG